MGNLLKIQLLLIWFPHNRGQRDERNKEFYALREEHSVCESRRRDAELKAKELQACLKNEASLRETAYRRYACVEQ